MRTEPQSDAATIDALKSATRFEQVRTQTGERADGTPIFSEGYAVSPSGEYVFTNEAQQSVHVPAARVAAELKGAAEAKKPAK